MHKASIQKYRSDFWAAIARMIAVALLFSCKNSFGLSVIHILSAEDELPQQYESALYAIGGFPKGICVNFPSKLSDAGSLETWRSLI